MQPREVGTARRERWLLWSLVALILVIYGFLMSVLFTYRDWPFDSDEAIHAIEGLQLAADLRIGQVGEFLHDVYFHRWYPPLLSIYLTPFLAILGPAFWAARYPLLLLVPLNLALLYRVGRLLWQRWEAGIVAVLLGATSPVLWMLGLLSMEESIAMTGLLLVIAGYSLSVRGKLNWLWVGLALALTLLARTSTGAFTSVALLLSCLVGSRSAREKMRVTVQVLGPAAITAFVWWVHPSKFQGLTDYFLASGPQQSTVTWSLLTHYWGQILSTHTAGWGIGLIVVVSIALSFRQWKDPVVRFLLLLFFITWAALVLKRQLAPRLFFTALTPAFLLTAFQAAAFARRIKGRMTASMRWFRNITVAGLMLYALAAVTMRLVTFPFLMEVAYETDPQTMQVQAWVTQRVTEGDVFFVNGWDQLSAPVVSWYRAKQSFPYWDKDDVINVELHDPEERPDATSAFQKAVLNSPDASIIHLENTPVAHAGAWWAYRATLTDCWDGNWEDGMSLSVKIWDSGLEKDVLAHPRRFLRSEDREEARQSLWYSLPIEIHSATCAIDAQ